MKLFGQMIYSWLEHLALALDFPFLPSIKMELLAQQTAYQEASMK